MRATATEVIMPVRNKFYAIIFFATCFVAVLVAPVLAVDAEENTNTTIGQEIVIGPETHPTHLASLQPWIIDGEVVGSIASYVYIDVSTRRAADYWEVYNQDGELLAFSWFDQFGILRIAIDEGILKDEDNPEGNFVVIIDGELI